MKHIILFFILVVLCSSFMFAQEYGVKGVIKDEHSKPLPYATVTLSGSDSILVKGVVTDSTGHYVLSEMKKGKYLFAAKCMGFEPFSTEIELSEKEMNMLDIILNTSNYLLDEVEVKGKAFIRKGDYVLILPSKQQIKHASNGYDLLYNLMIPGMEVDRQNGTVKNFNGTVSMYINGQRADVREIQSLRPRDIKDIEYHDVPTGIYSNEKAVINYVTKVYTSGGYISLDGRQSIGYLNGSYNAVAKINHGNTTYKFFGGHTMSKLSSTAQISETFKFGGYDLIRERNGYDAQTKSNNQYGRFDIINATQKRTLMAKFTFACSGMPFGFMKENLTYGKDNDRVSSSSYSENSQNGWMPNVDFMGNFKVKKDQMLLVYLNGSYSRNNYGRAYEEKDFRTVTDVNEDFYKGFGSLQYTIGMKHHNSLTLQFNHLYQNSKSVYTGDYNDRQQLWSAESFFYANYNQRINSKLSLYAHAGFSSLQYKLLGKNRVDRIGPRLNGRLTVQPKQNQFLQVAFDITSTYPTLDRLNGIAQEIDPFMIKRGNPDMDNSLFYQANVGYNAQFRQFNIMAAASYFYSTHTVAEHYYIDHDRLISSYSSDAGFQFANIMVEITWRATNNLSIKAKGQWLHNRISRLTNKNHHTWLGGVIMDYYLRDWKFNLYANLPYKMVDTSLLRREFEYKANYGASIGWNRDGWSVEVGTNNPFTKDFSIITILNTDVYRNRQVRHDESLQQTGYVKLSYTFDFGRKTDREKNDTNTTINSTILKNY